MISKRFLPPIATVLALLLISSVHAQVPFGYEVIDISSEEGEHTRFNTNNCGEAVYSYKPQDGEFDIFQYDNGSVVQITTSPLRDLFPDINDAGVVVWQRFEFGQDVAEFELLKQDGDDVTLITIGGSSPRINSLGQIAWDLAEPETCLYESGIWLYDSETVYQIDPPALSNQTTAINDSGEVVWTRYDFSNCSFDWTSDIMYWSLDNPVPVPLPANHSTGQGVDINKVGQVVWSSFPFVELYSSGVTETLTQGSGPSINKLGDIAFARPDDPIPPYQIWLYKDGEFRWITSDFTVTNIQPEINDYGEVVWWWHPNGGFTPSGIRMMRRMRNADIDNDQDVHAIDFAGVPSPTGYPSGEVNFAACMTGPFDTDRLCDCRFFDIHQDRAVDLRDFAEFQTRIGKPVVPWIGNCCESSILEGCTSQGVADCVCATYPQCCTNQWTSQCAEAVETLGCAECQ